ncbi:glycosyltransferase family 2 protein [Parabacteroides goldsteinii]|uniref:glycosyltransferase family 2 protein n=1 Tax=Parabacteroides goldsteinii TaxID=328812 RepID=UPI001F22278B|nr:glycosyltransferase [Parabacteroides goldsteinii]
MNKKVSIITVNYNGVTDTCEMIESLKRHENYPYELIVVDNGSASLNDYTLLKEKYPDAKVIRNDINLGFAEGNNIGVKQATGDYFFPE